MPLDGHPYEFPTLHEIPSLIGRLQQGQRSALARLLTLAASGQHDATLKSAIASSPSLPPVIAVTGSGGVGKSSLLGAVTRRYVEAGESVGVLACDPESPVTGGALLGDRCRLSEATANARLFVRSLSTASGHQGIAGHIDVMLHVMKAFHFDRIFVETVGAGQGDIAVCNVANLVLLVVQPQTGDELQWEKAGILELADLVVVNKSDLPGADRTLAEIRQQLNSACGRDVPVLQTSVARTTGIDELCEAMRHRIQSRPKTQPTAGAMMSVPDKAPQGSIDETDAVLEQIADYVCSPATFSSEAWSTARLCLLDSLGCALLALNYPECTKLLGPIVPGAVLPGGARVPGTPYELDPLTAAFNIGCMLRWLDYNDTWLAAEWGHPSDNFGGILAVADYLSRSGQQLSAVDVLEAAIKAYEIQGVLALENAFNRVGLDHVLLVRIATTAVVTRMLGGTRQHVIDAVSNAFLDGGALRTYRHAPNTGSRKSWAAGDATRRGVQHGLWALAGERGYATALSAAQWGFEDVVLRGAKLKLARPLGGYVMENILFKVAFPAEFHAQTAAEAALILHPQILDRWNATERIRVETQESAIRIIDKTGPLKNPADRDHCLQYIVAVALVHGHLDAEHYEDLAASDPRIDRLRERMEVVEQPRYSQDYLDPNKRSIANSVQVFFQDGSATERVEIEFPLGHRRRRAESIPLLRAKLMDNLGTRMSSHRVAEILDKLFDGELATETAFADFIEFFVGDSSASKPLPNE